MKKHLIAFAVMALAAGGAMAQANDTVSYTHLRDHETPEQLVCRLLLEKNKKDHRYGARN